MRPTTHELTPSTAAIMRGSERGRGHDFVAQVTIARAGDRVGRGRALTAAPTSLSMLGMRWLWLLSALVLVGCPTPTVRVPDASADLDALAAPDAEVLDGAPAADAQPPDDAGLPDALPPDAEAGDSGLVLRGALRAGAAEVRTSRAILRGQLSVSTTTRARTRNHVISGGLGPLGP